MDTFFSYFETVSTLTKFLWIVGVMFLGTLLENTFSLFQLSNNKWKHVKVNLLLLAMVMFINTLFSVLSVGIFKWGGTVEFGVLYLFDIPVLLEFLIAFLFLDFIAQYGVHYLLHKVKWMWRLHLVHHSDRYVTVTTGTRHHPIDFIIRECFALFAVVITGMPFSFYVLYRFITIWFTYMTHANLKLPIWLDKTLSYVFVTPLMHKFHHHDTLPWTDTNFGNVLSIWDRVFGTFLYDDYTKINYGVDIVNEKNCDNLKYQLQLPLDTTVKYKN